MPNSLIPTFQSLYDSTFKTEIDSAFYQSIHDYIDVIVKTPELSTLIEKESQKLKNDLREIKNDPVLLQRKKVKLIERTEQLSIYKDYINLYSTIYVPLEDQTNGVHVDSNTLYYLLGIEALSEKDQAHVGWSFKKHHEDYEKYFKDLHSKLVPLIEKMEAPKERLESVEPKQKLPLSFNNRTGDFSFYNTTGNLSLGGQEYKVFSALYNASDYQAPYLALIQSYNPNVEVAQKSYKNDLFVIIRNIKERFNILPASKTSNFDIFLNIKNYGYRLISSPANKSPE